jgi:hypothetical protein
MTLAMRVGRAGPVRTKGGWSVSPFRLELDVGRRLLAPDTSGSITSICTPDGAEMCGRTGLVWRYSAFTMQDGL